jgi:outer membrane protein OmpA-like peptidoglycan-associated protein
MAFSGCKSSKKGAKGKVTDNPAEAVYGSVLGGKAGAAVVQRMSGLKPELEAVLFQKAVVETVKKGEALKVTFASGLLFMKNASTLSDTAKYTLRQVAASLNKYPDADLKIIGYTDNTGKAEFNRILSERRAGSVRDYLVAQGVEANRLTSKGAGALEPAADNNTAEGRAKNRRVEIFLLAGDKMIQEAQKTQ